MQWNGQWLVTRWLTLATVVTMALATHSTLAAGQSGPNAPTAQVTFTKDIAPILQRSCQSCHRPGSVAPMSLITYEEVRPWARAIKHRVGLGSGPNVMPPWFIEKGIGIQQYKDDMSLRDDEIAKIAAWADAGAPQGNPADMPPVGNLTKEREWRLGKPDLIVSSQPIELRALQPDWWGALPTVPTEMTEDRYVASVEIKEVTGVSELPPGAPNRKTVGGQSIVHHLGFSVLNEKDEPVGTAMWPFHEVGRNPDVFDPEAGRLLPRNAKLALGNAHLHANGRRTVAHVEFGFKFHPKGYKPTKEFEVLVISAGGGLDVRPMEANQKLEGFFVLKENMKLMVYEPHLHAAGVRQCLDAIWGATSETLTCAGYNHGWVRLYTYADDAQPLLPKGTILRLTNYFDTTPANRNVSEPRNWSGIGMRSIDNMANAALTHIKLTDGEFEKEVAKRREYLRRNGEQTAIGCPSCGAEMTTTAVRAQ